MSPGTKEVNKDDESLPKVLGDDRKYRSFLATINFMATDMPDLQFACKEACREMSAPTVQSWKKIKRIGRYLLGREKVVWKFPWKNGHGSWKVFTDSDWAGDLETRKSTSGGIIMLGEHCMKIWSTNQSSPALSSAGSLNPADILTKHKGLRDFEEQLKRVNVHVMVRGSDQGGGGGESSGGPRVVSWADALEEEQEKRDINNAGMQHVDGSGRLIAAVLEIQYRSAPGGA